MALLLSLACVAAIERDQGNDGWPPALLELDSEVFPRASEDYLPVTAPAKVSPSLVDELYRLRKGGPPPSRPRRRRPRNAGTADPPLRDPRAVVAADAGAFSSFLIETVEPSALVLLAGVVLSLGEAVSLTLGSSDEHEDVGATWDRGEVLKELVGAFEDRSRVRPRWLADSVAARSDLSGRSHYNLACFYAQAAVVDDEEPRHATLERSRKHLVTALATTSPTGRRDLIAWAKRDPSLQPALRDWPRAAVFLGAEGPGEAPLPGSDAPSLGDIVSIGAWAEALGDVGVRTPGALRLVTERPGGVEELAELARVERETVVGWANLVRLLDIDGVDIPAVNLLDIVAIGSVDELAAVEARLVQSQLSAVNARFGFAPRTPTIDEVSRWIAQARRLSRGWR